MERNRRFSVITRAGDQYEFWQRDGDFAAVLESAARSIDAEIIGIDGGDLGQRSVVDLRGREFAKGSPTNMRIWLRKTWR